MGVIHKISKARQQATNCSVLDNVSHAVSAHSTTVLKARSISRAADIAAPVRRNVFNLVINDDGSVSSGEEILDFGVKGDHCVTLLHFDTSNLLWRDSDASQYLAKLCFTINNANYIYEFDGEDFEIPVDLTQYDGTYSVLYILQEVTETDNATGGNLENLKEVFVSNEFYGTVRELAEKQPAFITPFVYTESANSLIKSIMNLVLADDGALTADVLYIGNNQDAYVRFFEFTGMPTYAATAHVNGVFWNGRKSYSSEMTPSGKIWLPAEVTRYADYVWHYSVYLSWYDEDNELVYQFVSENINVEVVNNSLLLKNLNTDIGKGSGSNVQANKYSNFISADDKYIQTKDGQIFFWNEQ